jgi:hypothetical protein
MEKYRKEEQVKKLKSWRGNEFIQPYNGKTSMKIRYGRICLQEISSQNSSL